MGEEAVAEEEGAIVPDAWFIGVHDYGDDFATVLFGGADEDLLGGDGVAGFDARATGEALEEAIVIGDGESGAIWRGPEEGSGLDDFAEEGLGHGESGDESEVARGGKVIGVMEAVGVGEVGVEGAEFGGAGVHFFGEGEDGSRVIAGEGVGDIVGAFEEEPVEHLESGKALAWFEFEAAFADLAIFESAFDFLVEVTGFDDEESGEDFGGAGGELGDIGIFFVEGGG